MSVEIKTEGTEHSFFLTGKKLISTISFFLNKEEEEGRRNKKWMKGRKRREEEII